MGATNTKSNTWGGIQAGLMSAMSDRYQNSTNREAGSRRYIPAMSEDQKQDLSEALKAWREERDSDPWVAYNKKKRQERKERSAALRDRAKDMRLDERERRLDERQSPKNTDKPDVNDYSIDASKLKLSDEELMSNIHQYLKGLR